MLVDGKWTTRWYSSDEKGRFLREKTRFHGRVTADGSSGFPGVAGRYHLYVSLACPWAHRTLIVRKLKKLEEAITVSVVGHFMGEDGWQFTDEPGAIPDYVGHAKLLREIYVKADPKYTGRVTVPVLWDKETSSIVNNESSEIIRMLDHELPGVADASVDLCPPDLRAEVDRVIEAIYAPINDGVYRCGFAEKQEAYDEAVSTLFAALDHWEGVLSRQRYTCGDRFTEADVCLFTTLLRFDLVYHTHFKCNVKKIAEYPALSGFLREVYQMPGIAETCDFEHITKHYYRSHESLNPKRIVARGPDVELLRRPHGRDHLPRA